MFLRCRNQPKHDVSYRQSAWLILKHGVSVKGEAIMCYDCAFLTGMDIAYPKQILCNDEFTGAASGAKFVSNCTGVVCRKTVVMTGGKSMSYLESIGSSR